MLDFNKEIKLFMIFDILGDTERTGPLLWKIDIKRVTDIAIKYLSTFFNDVLDFNSILNGYKNRVDIESKVVHMLDKIHSSITFIKYQSEKMLI